MLVAVSACLGGPVHAHTRPAHVSTPPTAYAERPHVGGRCKAQRCFQRASMCCAAAGDRLCSTQPCTEAVCENTYWRLTLCCCGAPLLSHTYTHTSVAQAA